LIGGLLRAVLAEQGHPGQRGRLGQDEEPIGERTRLSAPERKPSPLEDGSVSPFDP
jgi:hypothetical protein